ncbi:MAG: iron-containing alcohol dehydrogenase [Aureliella sp.]
MENIDFQHRTRLVFGNDSIEQLGDLAKEQGARRVLVVSDPGVVSAGHFQRGVDALQKAGLQVAAFHGVRENPSTSDVEAGRNVASDYKPDLLVGLGGGSSMDCAKGINFLHSCGGRMEDYWGVGKATDEMLPMIAVPTTAGTGSEAQSFALISQEDSHVKMACGDSKAACRVAILDPKLTLTQPASVTALTGVDALSHALESYVTKRRNPLSVCYSRQAWQLLSTSFAAVLDEPENLEARGRMQLGAFFAGLGIETSMLGAAHALANPLTARYGVVHGQAVGMMLPQVIRFNGEQVGDWYGDLWRDISHTELGREYAQVQQDDTGAVDVSAALSSCVHHLVQKAGLATELKEVGVEEASLDQLAEDATSQWTGTFNPRPLSRADFREIYERTMHHRSAS